MQSVQGESEIQARKITSLEKRLQDVEESKIGLDRQLEAASRRHEELEVGK